MSFFTTSDGEPIEQVTEFANTGIQPLIPAGTQLLCAIAGATWEDATNFDNEYINIMLHVVQRGDYKDFIVNHKLRVNDNEPKKKDKALKMLMAYDTNCKGGLLATDKAGKKITDAVLARALNGGEIVATFDVWEQEGNDGVLRTGNWVRAIGPKPKSIQAQDAAIQKQADGQQPAQTHIPADDDYNDDIPF